MWYDIIILESSIFFYDMWQMYDIILNPNLKLKEKKRENVNKNENKIEFIIYNSGNISLSSSGLNLLSSLSTYSSKIYNQYHL